MATTFPATSPTNNVTAVADLLNTSASLLYSPVANGLDERGAVASILRQLLTVLPAIKTSSVTFDMASVAANTTAEQNVTVTGILTTDVVLSVSPPAALNAGLGICGWRVNAADSITIRINNNTGGALDPASGSYVVTWTAKST